MRIERNKLEADYHAYDALSASAIRAMVCAKTRRHYKNAKGKRKATAAKSLGSLVHALIENKGILKNTVILPAEIRRSTKKHKEFILENDGKEIVRFADYQQAIGMYKGIVSHPELKPILDAPNGLFEESFFVEINGNEVKCRVDFRDPDSKIIFDFKTTIDASPGFWGFSKSVRKYRYDLQAALYVYILKLITGDDYEFIFVAVEKKENAEKDEEYEVAFHNMKTEDLSLATFEAKELLDELAEREKTNNWGDGYGNNINYIEMGNTYERD